MGFLAAASSKISDMNDREQIQNVLKISLPKYLIVIIRRCQMCIEHTGQQFEQFV
jgi:hypothetical protein